MKQTHPCPGSCNRELKEGRDCPPNSCHYHKPENKSNEQASETVLVKKINQIEAGQKLSY